MLADGSVIPSPGQSVMVKLFNDYDSERFRLARPVRLNGRQPASRPASGGAGFLVGVDDGGRSRSQPAGRSGCLHPVAHPGHSGQPDHRTAARAGHLDLAPRRHGRRHRPWSHDERHLQLVAESDFRTVGPTVRRPPGTHQTLTTPRPGDGGYIYIGGNSLTDYDLTDPLDGSLIDNADICT